MSTRFEPRDGVPYGRCASCDATMPTKDDAERHMTETQAAAKDKRSHSVRIENPDRQALIEREVERVVEDAINRALERFDRLVEAGDASEEELKEALKWHDDFGDAWDEFRAENG